MSTYDHDREAGRQLAWVFLVVTVLFAVVFLGVFRNESAEVHPWLLVSVGAFLTGLGFIRPVIAIRLVSGRFSELFHLEREAAGLEPPPPGDAEKTLAALQEGVPVSVAVTEDSVESIRGRKRLGIGLMVAGALGLAAAIALAGSPDWLIRLTVGAFLGGLVLWYRTL